MEPTSDIRNVMRQRSGILLTVAVVLLIAVLSFVWYSMVPSFNPAVALRTLRHADDVEAIIEEAAGGVLQPGLGPRSTSDVRVVFTYDDACIIAYIENDNGTRIAHTYYRMEPVEGGGWGLVEAHTVPDGPMFPSPPSDFTCD